MIRVLYVDDEPDLLEIGKIFLEQLENFSVTTALSAADALALLRDQETDAIVSDYQMPGEDGIALLKTIRLQYPDLPFILFTGRGREEVVIAAIENGADFYLQKGGDPRPQYAELGHKIRQALGKRQAEKSLRESEERYKSIISVSNTGAWEYHKDTNYLWCSPEYFTMLGYDPREFIDSGRVNLEDSWKNLLHPDDRQKASQVFSDYVRSGSPGMYDNHFRMRHKDGHWIWVWSRGKNLRNPDGTLTQLTVGTHIDITARKLAEEALFLEHNQVLSIFDSMDMVIYVTDPATDEILFANKTVKDAFKKDVIGGVCYREFQGRETPCPFCTNELLKKQYPEPCRWEFYNPRMNMTLDIHDRLIRWPDGREVRLEIAIDITRRKQAEEMLRDQHWRLESIIEGTRIATWQWNVQTGETIFNERWAEIIGYTLEELAPISIKTWEAYTHPDDLKQSGLLLEQHFAGELPYYELDCRMKHKDGRWIWVYDRGRVVTRTADGRPLLMFGIHTDITDRKQAEEALAENERFLNGIIEHLPDPTLVINTEGEVIAWSRAMEELTGVSAKEMVGRRDHEYALPFYGVRRPILIDLVLQHDPDTEKMYSYVHREGRTLVAETIAARLNGREILLWGKASPLFDKDGRIAGAIETIRDVTKTGMHKRD